MKRWIAVVVAAVVAVGGAIVAPAATAGTSLATQRLQPVIAASWLTTCAVRESHRVYCFGGNSSGELGRGNTTPTPTVAPVAATLSDAIAVYGAPNGVITGGGSFCALTMARTVKCWGAGDNYQLGNGAETDLNAPTEVAGVTNVTTVAMGGSATCAAKQDGSVWCWGGYSLITGDAADHGPRKIPGLTNVVGLSMGVIHACALRIDKTVWCWGQGFNGRLGNGQSVASSTPVKVSGMTDAVAITSGYEYTCAVRAGGTAVCWGSNDSGQLGHLPTETFADTPQSVTGLSGVTGLAGGLSTTCATTASAVKCWGSGAGGILGDTQTFDQPAPVRAYVGLPSPTAVAIGGTVACEIADGDKVWCWGNNNAAQAGVGSATAIPTGGGPGASFGFAAPAQAVRILNAAPGKPTGTSPSSRKIKITWTAPSTSNGTSAPKDYYVYYQVKGSSTWKRFSDPVTATRSSTVTGLSAGKYYRFKVVPKNWAGTGTASSVSSYIKSK